MKKTSPRKKIPAKTIEEFTVAHDEIADQLFRRCFYKLSNQELAIDAVSETFARTWEYLSSGKEIKNIKAFMFQVANNIIIDEYRKKKTISLDTLQEVGFDVPAGEQPKMLVSVEIETILSHIETLDEKYKEVILLRYINGFSPKEIADMLGQSENAISVRINRALKKMKELLNIPQ